MTSPFSPDDPLARAVLRKLADTHPRDEPLGSFARTVLVGETNLREAARHPWHGEALGRALTEAMETQRNAGKQDRAEVEEAANRLRTAIATDPAGTAPTDTSER